MTTHATIHHIDSGTMAVEFAFDEARKNTVAAMTGAEWRKKDKRWLVPVARLGDVVKLFWPNVTIDYDVLRARDEQLRRMFRQYRSMKINFALVDGKVTCDHDVLNSWFATNGNVLHVQALEHVLQEAAQPKHTGQFAGPLPPEDRMLALLLRGVKNAAIAQEKRNAMLAAVKRRKVSS